MPEPNITWSAFPNAYPRPLAGRLEQHTLTSALLADNPLGDPAERPLESSRNMTARITAVWPRWSG